MKKLKLKLFLTHWVFVLFAQCKFSICAVTNQTNICDTYGLCSQRCSQKDNTFECSCTQDFQLAPDNRTCNPKDGSWKLLYSTYDGLQIIVKSPKAQESGHSILLPWGRLASVTYDARNNVVYWTNKVYLPNESLYEFTIYKARFTEHNFSDPEIVANTGVHYPRGIAFDWITGNVYFGMIQKSQIVVCGNTTNLCAVILQDSLEKPQDIALHPNLGIMFWTDDGMNTQGIWRAEMGGESPIRIVSNIPADSIVIDQGNDRLYWVDGWKKAIASCRFDGTDHRHFVITQTRQSIQFGILGHQLFWSDGGFSQLKRADKFSGNNPEVLVNNFGGDYVVNSLVVMHLANQPIVRENPCQNHPCTHICTLNSNGFRCLCPVYWMLKEDNRSCADWQPKIVVGSQNVLKFIRLNAIGKNIIEEAEITSVKSIDKLVYNPNSGSLFISDAVSGRIIEYSHESSSPLKVLLNGVRSAAMDIDVVSETFYWVDEEQHSLKVMSLSTGAQLTLRDLTYDAIFRNLVVDSIKRILYLTRDNQVMEIELNGTYVRNFTVESSILHFLSYDTYFGKTFWIEDMADKFKFGTIGKKFPYLYRRRKPLVDFAKYGNTIYYTAVNSSFLNAERVDIWQSTEYIPLGSVEEFAKIVIMDPTPEYLKNMYSLHDCSPAIPYGKNCSHICLPTAARFVGICECPANFSLQADNKTCVSDQLPLECHDSQFLDNCKDSTTNIIWFPIDIFATISGIVCTVFVCT